MDKSGMIRSAAAPAYLRTRLSQTTGNIDAVSDGEQGVEKLSKPVVDVVGRDAFSVPSDLPSSSSRMHVGVVLRSGV